MVCQGKNSKKLIPSKAIYVEFIPSKALKKVFFIENWFRKAKCIKYYFPEAIYRRSTNKLTQNAERIERD